MRRLVVVVTLVVVGLLPTDAHAQGFWRWLEHLSGPKINGPGFDVVFACRGRQVLPRTTQNPQLDQPLYGTDQEWFANLYCVKARRDSFWISIGTAVYSLAGDNNQTAIEDDRVDVIGVMPFVDFNLDYGFAVSAGVGVRRYETGAGPFNKAVTEGVIKWRPLRTVARIRSAASPQPSLRQDFVELRFGAVYQSAFEAGQFGPGTPELDGDFTKVFVLAFNALTLVR